MKKMIIKPKNRRYSNKIRKHGYKRKQRRKTPKKITFDPITITKKKRDDYGRMRGSASIKISPKQRKKIIKILKLCKNC